MGRKSVPLILLEEDADVFRKIPEAPSDLTTKEQVAAWMKMAEHEGNVWCLPNASPLTGRMVETYKVV